MIKKWFSKITTYVKENEQKRWFIIGLAIVGIVLIMFSDFFRRSEPIDTRVMNELPETQETISKMEDQLISEIQEMEKQYEKALQDMLNKISGISEVEVMVNIDSTNVQMYEKDMILGTQTTVETDQSGGKRTVEDETKETKMVYVRKGDQEVPVLIKTEKPTVRGVFIIAKGVDNAAIKQQIIEAVSRVLDVPTFRISVLPK